MIHASPVPAWVIGSQFWPSGEMGRELWQRNEDIPNYARSRDKVTYIYTVDHLELTMRYNG